MNHNIENMSRVQKSFYSSNNCGNDLAVSEHQKICGQVLTDTSGLIVSPDLDEDGYYEMLTECSWIIEAADDELIELKFLSMDLEMHIEESSTRSCLFDYVQVLISIYFCLQQSIMSTQSHPHWTFALILLAAIRPIDTNHLRLVYEIRNACQGLT